MGTMEAVYNVINANRNVEFAIPFLSSAIDTPEFSVLANEQEVSGTIIYGDTLLIYDNIDYTNLIENLHEPQINSNIIDTLYKVIPDNDVINICLTFDEGKRNCIVYDTSNHCSSTSSADGNYTWTLKNALSKSNYTFFIVGNRMDHSFSCSCEYEESTMTCKEFINIQYNEWGDYYSEYNIPLDYFYSIFDKALQNKTFIEYDILFFNSLTTNRFNLYKFSLPIISKTTISYKLPINIQRNYAFSPSVYSVEQKHINNYPINYKIELNNNTPFIIDATSKTQNVWTYYIAETTNDFFFVFCSSDNPKYNLDNVNNNQINQNQYTIFILIISLIISVVIILIFLFHKLKNK